MRLPKFPWTNKEAILTAKPFLLLSFVLLPDVTIHTLPETPFG